MKWFRKLMYGGFILLVTLTGITAFCSIYVGQSASEYLFDNVDTIPVNRVGLVLGTAQYLKDGRPNLFFSYRIEACAELYKADKITYVIVSGDNGQATYNEPRDMKKALIARDIPAERIFMDFAGFRTLDSVVRCREIFGQNSFTIISQRFHNARAVYIAKAKGMDVVGFNAKNVKGHHGISVQVREWLARVKMMWDIHIAGTQPKFLGEPIAIE